MSDIPEKVQKRGENLIRTEWAVWVMLAFGICTGPFGAVWYLILLAYGRECGTILRDYPDADPQFRRRLERVRVIYLSVGWLVVGIWTVLTSILAYLIFFE